MNILIVGSQGFIGSHLVEYFVEQGHAVTGCDLTEASPDNYAYQKVSVLSADFDTLFTAKIFDVCINAAGSGNVSYSMSHPLSDFEANCFSVNKILDTIRKHHPACRYLHISSAAVYGNPKQLPIGENDVLSPVSAYGYHKWISEIICKEYHHLYHLPITVLRPFSVFGNGLKKQLLWDICGKLKKSNNITLYGTGNESRDFLHISDLVLLSDLLIRKGNFNCGIYNAASGKETTIRYIADIFERNYPDNKKISFSGEIKEGDPINWRACIASAEDIGFTPTANLEQRIVEYIRWFGHLPQD